MIKAQISKNVIKRNRNGKMNFEARSQRSKIIISAAVSAVCMVITYTLLNSFLSWDVLSWVCLEELTVCVFAMVVRIDGMNIFEFYFIRIFGKKDIRLFDKKSFLNDRDRGDKK